MSFLIGELVANVKADSGQFRREVRNVERQGAQSSRNVQRSFDGIGSKLTQLTFLAKALFTSGLVMGARNAVREFAFLEGAMAKFNVVFGAQAKEVEAWVNEFREGVPLARREIIQAAAAMQDLLVPMGVARENASEMTKEWLELAAALAAFNDVPVDRALEAIRSGIAGQSRPLREFGIDARETALQQTALAEGLIRSGEQMNDQVRQQALLIQSYAQSKDAVDGYEDQLGTTLIMEQELGAQFKDTLAVIGEELQPAYNDLVQTLGEMLSLVNKNQSALSTFMDTIKGVLQQQASWQLLGYLRDTITVVNALQSTTKTLNDQWNEFLQTPVEDLKIDDVAKQLNSVTREMERMLQSRRDRGLDTEATKATEAYQELLGRMVTLQSILRRVDDDARSIGDEFIDWDAKARRTVESTRDLSGELEKIKHIIIDDDIDTAFEEPLDSLRKFVETAEGYDPMSPLPPAGSIAAISQEMEYLNRQLELATDDERIAQLNDRIRELQKELSRIREIGLDEEFNDATGAADFFSRTLADGLDQVLFRARSVEDAIKGIVRQLASRALTTGIMGLLGGGFGGSFVGAMFGGNRASGGHVEPGRGYIVGERGPEMFYPQSSGKIASNQQMEGGSKKIDLRVHVTGDLVDRNGQIRSAIEEQSRQIQRLQ